MTLKFELIGSDTVTYKEFSAKSISDLSRLLITNGMPDQDWQASRGSMVCLTGNSISNMAEHTIEGTNTKERYVKYHGKPY